jgi:hypothetical protein
MDVCKFYAVKSELESVVTDWEAIRRILVRSPLAETIWKKQLFLGAIRTCCDHSVTQYEVMPLLATHITEEEFESITSTCPWCFKMAIQWLYE